MELVDLFLVENLDFMGTLRRDACISPCGKYRYWLTRTWGPGKVLPYIMLNPSTADANVDDQTVRRCIYFARREGYDGLVVLNLYAYRTAFPKELVKAQRAGVDVVGPENLHHIHERTQGASKVVLAWGNLPLGYPWPVAPTMRATFAALPRDVEYLCLGATVNESPRHPSRLGNKVAFEEYLPSISELPEDSRVRRKILGG